MMTRNGFTLFETLIVLCLLSVCFILVPLPNLTHWQQEIQLRLFFDQVVHQLNLSQTHAITMGVPIHVVFSPNQQHILFRPLIADSATTVMTLPEHWALAGYHQFSYFPNGHIDRFSTIRIVHTDSMRYYTIIFQLGSGRFDIQSER